MAGFHLIAALVLLASVLRNEVKASDNWFKNTAMYQVYMNSFKDSNDDGVGDFKGIISKLDYLQELGIETIWLTPFLQSPITSHGYEISDYYQVHPQFGSMEDYEELVKEIKNRGMKVLNDMVLNHCSYEHPWFLKSVKRVDPYTDYFVWRDPKGYDDNNNPIVPNNWESVMSTREKFESIWTWNDERKQYYLHQFASSQPDFNMANSNVIEELKNIVRFWLDKGCDAMRLDAGKQFAEDPNFEDEPYGDDGTQWHTKTYDQPGSYEVVHQLREMIENEYVSKDGHDRPLIPEVLSPTEFVMRWYGNSSYRCANLPQNTFLVQANIQLKLTAKEINNRIHVWLDNAPKDAVVQWPVENHDDGRIPERNPMELVDMMNILMLGLKGMSVTYNGGEIGMRNNEDIDGDERYRTPMQWDSSKNAGFTMANNPWLPINSNYQECNVEVQQNTENSHLNVFKRMSMLRREPTFRDGNTDTYLFSDNVLVVRRSLDDRDTYFTVLNFGNYTETVDLTTNINDIPSKSKVVVSSGNSNHGIDKSLDNSNVQMNPKSAVVLKV